jgi:valyl-tRNA synthetase
MKKELDPKYDHLKVEQEHNKTWIDKGYFTAGDKSKDPFCIVIPPPNVTPPPVATRYIKPFFISSYSSAGV